MKHLIDPVDIAAGARLRARRRELNLTQERVAAALSVTFQQVRKYENGTNRLSPLKILILSRLLQVEPSYFFQIDLRPNVAILREEEVVMALDQDEDWLQLNKDFRRIVSPEIRRKLVALVLALADEAAS